MKKKIPQLDKYATFIEIAQYLFSIFPSFFFQGVKHYCSMYFIVIKREREKNVIQNIK